MSKYDGLASLLTGMGHSAPRVNSFLDTLQPAMADRLLQAAESGDTRSLLRAFADQTWTTAPARPAQQAPSSAQARIPLDERLANDPKIQAGLEEAGIPTAGMSGPQMLEAYAEAFQAAGRRKPKTSEEAIRELLPSRGAANVPARQMELPMGDGPPPNDLRATFGDQANWEETGRIAERLMGERPNTGMIPYGQRGPGVPGGLSGPGVRQPQETGMIPAPLRGIPGEGQRRLGSRAGVPGDLTGPGVMVRGSRGLSTDVRLPRLTDENSFDASAKRWADNFQDPSGVRSPPPGASAGWQRLANSPAGRIAGGVGIAGAGIGAIDLMMPNENGDPPVRGSSTADLAAESRPIPSVESTPDEAPAMPEAPAPEMPPDYSFQARELMNKLNAMRRQAGGEIPEAPQMMAEINRLLGMSNKQRNAPGYQPAMPTDHHGQAQMLLQKLNAMRMEAGGEVPEAQQIMAEVRRHQAMGDQMRNAR
jgi:hypothetical protein